MQSGTHRKTIGQSAELDVNSIRLFPDDGVHMGDSSPVIAADSGGPSSAGCSGTAASIGCHVEVELIGQTDTSERLAFDIVPDTRADFAHGFLGAGTPLARAILGKRAGSAVTYRVDDIREVWILSVRPSTRVPNRETPDHDAVLQKAISKSELAEAARLSLTVDLKWGSTDPQGMEDHWE
jgi:hypothetical protein